MDERYSRLQSVIDDLIGERDRILDEAIEMSKDLQEARQLAKMYHDALTAYGVVEPGALPWEEGANDHD